MTEINIPEKEISYTEIFFTNAIKTKHILLYGICLTLAIIKMFFTYIRSLFK